MELKILKVINLPDHLLRVEIWPTYGGYNLNIHNKNYGRFEAYDGYTFKSVASAKQYFSRYFKRRDLEKYKWEHEIIKIEQP